MADYTVVNLKEVEDQAPKFGMNEMEFRSARVPLELENSGLSFLRVDPNYRVPFGHNHKQQEEVYILVDGSARLKLDDEIVDLRQWDAVRIPPEVLRCLEAGPDGLEVILVGAPNPRDAEMVPGWWRD